MIDLKLSHHPVDPSAWTVKPSACLFWSSLRGLHGFKWNWRNTGNFSAVATSWHIGGYFLQDMSSSPTYQILPLLSVDSNIFAKWTRSYRAMSVDPFPLTTLVCMVLSQIVEMLWPQEWFLPTNWFPWQPKYKICQFQVWFWISLFQPAPSYQKFLVSISNSSKVMAKGMFFSNFLSTNWFPWQPKYKIQFQAWSWISLANVHLHAKFQVSTSNSSKVMAKRMFFSEILVSMATNNLQMLKNFISGNVLGSYTFMPNLKKIGQVVSELSAKRWLRPGWTTTTTTPDSYNHIGPILRMGPTIQYTYFQW